MSDTDDIIAKRVKGLRVDQPDICWRPSPDWKALCIKHLGHSGSCGWDHNSQSPPFDFPEPIGPPPFDPCAACPPTCDSIACPKRMVVT